MIELTFNKFGNSLQILFEHLHVASGLLDSEHGGPRGTDSDLCLLELTRVATEIRGEAVSTERLILCWSNTRLSFYF